MSTCPDEELYCAFVDDEVSPTLKKELEDHIFQCERCKRIVDRFRFLKKSLVSHEVLDLNVSFDNLVLKRNLIEKKQYRMFYMNKKCKMIASAVAGVFLFTFLFVLLRNNSSYDKTYTLHRGSVQFTPIVPMTYRQHNNIVINMDLYDMTSVIKTNEKHAKKIYGNLTDTFNNFTYLYAPLENDLNDFAVTMPNAGEHVFYNYGMKMPIYTNFNKNVK